MTVRKLLHNVHLFFGISTGLLVFIIALTGCIYAFQVEIRNAIETYRYVASSEAPQLPPSYFKNKSEEIVPGKSISSIRYNGKERAVEVNYNKPRLTAYMNPYDGSLQRLVDPKKNFTRNFFRWILRGHFYLWLPSKIGRFIVSWTMFIFLITVISGLIIWIPKKWKLLKQGLKFSWKKRMRWRRKNYDLHRIFGFYSLLFSLIFIFTALVWEFRWFATAYHKFFGGKSNLTYSKPVIQKPTDYQKDEDPFDLVWEIMKGQYPKAKSIQISTPENESSTIAAVANFNDGTYWKEYRYFDPYTLEEKEVDHIYGKHKNLNFGDKVYRMNYDLHTGGILGIWGKIIAFLSTLIIASLPITGFLIWWGRRNKS